MDDFTKKDNFPFRSFLSVKLLVEYWERTIRNTSVQEFTKGIQEYIDNAPELKEPISDPAVIEKHRPFIEYMLSAVVPQAGNDKDLIAAVEPFRFSPLYATEGFKTAIDLTQVEHKGKANFPGNNLSTGRIIKGCLMILEKFYNTDTQFDRPVLFTWRDDATGLDRVYKVEINDQFCEIIARNEPRPIDRKVIKFLMEKTFDVDLWLQYIRPEDYEFQGFVIMRLVDVTEQEMLSSIKYDLLEKSAVVRNESFAIIQQKLRSLFRLPDMRLGIAYLDPNNNLILNNAGPDCWKSLAGSCCDESCYNDYEGSVYERSWKEKRYLTIEDLDEYPFRSSIENTLLTNGIRNILLAPLVDGDETIGMLELATPNPGQLNPFSAHKVENVLPMFTAAVKRVKEEMATEVRALIQEECTAIHPTVQWRFFEAGLRLLNSRRTEAKPVMEEIVFKDVYPLFGMADVRNSSIERNRAIQRDLQENLQLVRGLLEEINEKRKLPLLDEVIFKVDSQIRILSRGLASGDESNILDFLKNEIEPLIKHFSTDPFLAAIVQPYMANLDADNGVVYKRRKAFEESLQAVNKTISTFLDEAEVSAQQMFPHYFEKYRTDGVEYSIYVGSSLLKDRSFDPFYLRNFHLWQLLAMSEIHRRVEALKPSLKVPLEITQLILVHESPISIRFRSDEKRFDVDGAYDIRYEIIKKRIDKAYIKNTNERLTQPGKIAIVYNQAKVEDEFRRYFQYLKARDLVTGEIEEIELEELPGATGLRALRFQLTNVERQLQADPDSLLLQEIEQGLIQNLSIQPRSASLS